MSGGDTDSPGDTPPSVLVVPPENNSNHYLSSLTGGLEQRGVDVVDYEWNTAFPILRPALADRPDVIHIHWLNVLVTGSTRSQTLLKGLRTPFELLIVGLLGINVVWTVHNLTAHDPEYPRWDLLWRVVVARWCCDHLTVHCESAAETVRERYGLGREASITVIPHGHYVDAYPRNPSKSEARRTLGLDADEAVFLFFGQIRPYKQVPRLIEAFESLDCEGAKLVVAGNPRTDSLQRRIERACGGRDGVLTRLEFVPDDEVSRYFVASDAVVLPYRDILTSGSTILAMSFRRPAIVPRIGCIPDLVTDGVDGVLYDPEAPDGLEEAMDRALDRNLAEMGEAGYETVVRLDWESIAARTERVYTA